MFIKLDVTTKQHTEMQGMGCFRDLWWAGMEGSSPLAAIAGRIRRALAEIRGGLCG